MGDLAQALTPKEVEQKTEFEHFLILHYLVAELRGREHDFSRSCRWNYLFDPNYIVSVNWKLRVVLFLGWSSTDVLYVFSFGLQKREPPLPPPKQTTKPPETPLSLFLTWPHLFFWLEKASILFLCHAVLNSRRKDAEI